MSGEDSQRIAEDPVKSSPTLVFDGIEGTLKLIDTLSPRCPYCFEFESRHVLATVIEQGRCLLM